MRDGQRQHTLSKSFEPALRTLAWLLPGRFDDSDLIAECIFTTLNLISIHEDTRNANRFKHFKDNDHTRFINDCKWGRLHSLSSKSLSIINSVQLLGEILLNRREKKKSSINNGKQRWNYIVMVETIKFVLKLIIIFKSNFRPIIHPVIPSREVDVTLDPEYIYKDKPKSIRDFRKDYGYSLNKYLNSVALNSDQLVPPKSLVRPLSTPTSLISELIFTFEPLAYALALKFQFDRTNNRFKPWRTKLEWNPILISIALSLIARQLKNSNNKYTKFSPYHYQFNKSKIESDEDISRNKNLIHYLFKGPIWSDFTKPKLLYLIQKFDNWPLINIGTNILGDYIPLIDNYHFYICQ